MSQQSSQFENVTPVINGIKAEIDSFIVTVTVTVHLQVTVPISFWHCMLCSGVRSISDPSMGDLNVTPSSVISASFKRDT
jgi:hypothetical protein